jgi:hypothetical protein
MPERFGPDRIQDHIAADLQEVSVLLNEDRFKPALEHVANSAVPLINGLGIHAV